MSVSPDASPPALTILAVDDDPLVCMGMASMLEELGHAVVAAHSGREAVAILSQRSDIALVITDVGMAGMSGLELAGTIAKEWPHVPIIFATGYAVHFSDKYPAGTTVLGKPFDYDMLKDAIDRAMKA